MTMANAMDNGGFEGLLMAMEISEKTWRLCLTDLKKERQVDVPAWADKLLMERIAQTKKRFGLSAEAPVYSCYEAGRQGFSLHRLLEARGIENLVIDPSSIEMPRRGRHRKTDRLDAERLCRLLVRYRVHGERKCWQVCRVPTREQEAARRLDREYDRLKKERKGHVCRIQSLLRLHGNQSRLVHQLKPGSIRDWSGELIEPRFQTEIGRELERLNLVEDQLKQIKVEREAALADPKSQADHDAARLIAIRGIGPVGATALARQFFSFRDFHRVREVSAASGLTGCPYNSGSSEIEQGISKAGNRRIRTLAVELAWMWLHHQPTSALSQWFRERFGHGAKRLRRVGIVALARKLLVALWKYLRQGLIPEGAVVDLEAAGLASAPEGVRSG